MITFKNITKSYGHVKVLDKLSFSINPGEFVVLIGPSGCGKTTTLKMINRLIEADSGDILVDGKNIHDQDAVSLRRTIGYVIQQIGLFPNMTVAQNISIVPKMLKASVEEQDKIVHELLQLVDMPYADYAHKYPSELSGGQQQRIGVLRALAASPPIVLMDEPFGALDPITRDTLQDEVKKLQKKLKKTIVFVTHDMDEAIRMADTIVFMNQGKIVQMASPEEMLRNPSSEIIKGFMGKHLEGSTMMLAEDFMRKKVLKVPKTAQTLQCIELMKNRDVNSLVVIDEDDTYLGTVSIDTIKKVGKAGHQIEALISDEIPVVQKSDDAKAAFDTLLNASASYLIVLNEDRTVAGLITKTSMAKALGEALWGELPS